MEVFISLITAYPVVLYTFGLVLVVLYWLVASMGLLDIDALDLPDPESDMDLDVGAEGLAGLLLKVGLNGVPLTIVLSLLILLSWIFSYFASLLLMPIVPGAILWFFAGTAILIGAWVVAVPITAILIKPLKPLFAKTKGHSRTSVLGQVAIIRTSRVDETFGEADFNDGGAGLVLKVRAETPNEFKRGDRAVLLEYLETDNAYRVIPERDFY